MRQVPRSPLSFKLQRVANVPEHPPPSTRLMSCAHIANRRLSRIIGVNQVAISQRESIARASSDPTAGNEMKSEVGILSCTYSSQVIFETSMLTWARAE